MSYETQLVDRKQFFHLSPKGVLRAGQRLSTSRGPNRMWARLENSGLLFPDPGTRTGTPLDKLIRHALEGYGGQSPKLYAGYHFELAKTLQEASEVLMRTLMAVREMVFENVRREQFCDAPSRMRCIWLAPCIHGCLGAWTRAYKPAEFDVHFVRARGRLHYANARYTEGGTISLKSWGQLARHYWSGDRVGEPSTEVLLEGEVEVLEALSPEQLAHHRTSAAPLSEG